MWEQTMADYYSLPTFGLHIIPLDSVYHQKHAVCFSVTRLLSSRPSNAASTLILADANAGLTQVLQTRFWQETLFNLNRADRKKYLKMCFIMAARCCVWINMKQMTGGRLRWVVFFVVRVVCFFLEIRKASDVASVPATESCYICSAVSLYNQPGPRGTGIPNRFSFIPLYVTLVFVKQREKLKSNKVQTCLVVVRETPEFSFIGFWGAGDGGVHYKSTIAS